MNLNFADLSRVPDSEAPNLFAFDASDRLILDSATALIDSAQPDTIAVIGDRHGALTLGAVLNHGARGVRVYQDELLHERALAQNAQRLGGADSYVSHELSESLLAGVALVLLQLPRSLNELREIADAIARWARPDVTVIAGGRVKHMSLNMNELLKEYFGDVQASLARQKSRVLTATQAKPLSSQLPFPVWGTDAELKFKLASFGGTFGGSTLDHGTRLLLQHLQLPAGESRRVVDLGCGNGTIAAAIATALPGAQVIAVDQNRSAVRAAELTLHEAGVADQVEVMRADGCESIEEGWADLIVLNPPFHSGAAVDDRIAAKLIESAARVLKPGGELWIVMNSHLSYRPHMQQMIGETSQIVRDRRFTVLKASKRGL